MAVSYTHLDVYKRQGSVTATLFFFNYDSNNNKKNTTTKPNINTNAIAKNKQANNNKDVYKRQLFIISYIRLLGSFYYLAIFIS